ncbi:carbamoyltransferase family protein [Paenibacillus sp. MMS18-CY102]|uniref:carbamoyltransferase family protein n=1 Tax=Paenibacillus sp. MMS18-CY102 TaxID=2682849 RepID=UPI001366420D|nr:carbamoyltransferase C-terminal domain-containing protein [Paenibacillus sp. MMS18-CY102]
MYVLGLNCGKHDSSAALVKDGQLIAMAEQERFSRNKRAVGEAPVDAILFCLTKAGIGLEDVNAVALGWNYSRTRELYNEPADGRDQREVLFPKSVFKATAIPPIMPVDHHLAHAASAFWPSGFKESAILVVDGGGETESTTIAYGNGNGIQVLESLPLPGSLGHYYAAATRYVGMKARHAGKMMGLAAYGKPDQAMPLSVDETGLNWRGLSELEHSGSYSAMESFRAALEDHFEQNCFPFKKGTGEDLFAYVSFAASAQKSLEEAILSLAERACSLTKQRNIVLAGGVALNCSANGKLARSGIANNLFVQPAASDSGVSWGAALVLSQRLGVNMQSEAMRHAYWGPDYSHCDIEASLNDAQLKFERLTHEELIEQVAMCLHHKKIVGWFQGRAEIGPRALGARSILGNPTDRDTLIRLNRIKCREMWRPFAPSVAEESFHHYFDSPHPSPFMIVAAKVHESMRKRIPAVVHADGTARPQSVRREDNELYWKLLQKFGEYSGMPVLVNTSFNLDKEPIVHTPGQAITDFINTEMDVLAIGNYIVRK